MFKRLIILFRIRLIYTVYFNIRYLPFSQAFRLPIIFLRRAKINMGKNAKIILDKSVKGRVKIGDYQLSFSHGKEFTTITNWGKIIFHGGNIRIQAGSIWFVLGEVHLGSDIMFGTNSKLSCYNRVDVFNTCRIAHEVQIMDCDFHYLRDRISGQIKPISSPIRIGSCCWIGNRTSVMGGTILPDFTIVGSNSLINRDYSKIIESYSLIVGSPAKLIRENVERLSFVDYDLERELKSKEFGSISCSRTIYDKSDE